MRLDGLVKLALSPAPAAAAPVATVDPEERRRHLIDLKLWYDDWATTARSVIRKRSHLIRLGLATRRAAKKDEPAPTE